MISSFGDPLLPLQPFTSVKRPIVKEKQKNLIPQNISPSKPQEKQPTPPKKFKANTSRNIYSYESNDTASVEKSENVLSKTEVVNHAYERLQIAYAKAIAVWKTAEPVKDDLLVWIEGARAQGGSSKVPGHHATHPDMTSGFCDNTRELYIKLIKAKGVTKEARSILLLKGFTDLELDQMNEKRDPILINQLFEKRWQGKSSIIEEIKALAFTNSFPRIVNLRVDKALENNERESAAFLYNRCMKGEITPEELVRDLCKIINTFFQQRILRIEKKMENKENSKPKVNESTKKLIEYFKWELEGTQLPSFHLMTGVKNEEDGQLRQMDDEEKLVVRERLLRSVV